MKSRHLVMSKPLHQDQRLQMRANPSRKTFLFKTNKHCVSKPKAPIEGETFKTNSFFQEHQKLRLRAKSFRKTTPFLLTCAFNKINIWIVIIIIIIYHWNFTYIICWTNLYLYPHNLYTITCTRGNAVKDHDRRGHADRGRPHSFASKTLTSIMSEPTLDSIN